MENLTEIPLEKICKRCQTTKPLDQYPIHAGCKNGRDHTCKICVREIGKIYREKNKEKIKEKLRLKREFNSKNFIIPDLNSKICSKCKQEKDIVNFHFSKTANRFNTHCNKCRSERRAKWIQKHVEHITEYNNKNKEKRKQQNKLRYEANKERIKKVQAIYEENNKEKIREFRRNYYLKNKRALMEKGKQYRIKNQEKLKAKRKSNYEKNKLEYYQKKKNDPRRWITCALRIRVNKALRNNQKTGSTFDLLGLKNAEELKLFLESKFQNGMTWNNYGKYGWHVDHIRPCASFDLTDPAQQRECFHYTNLQPMWASDNLSKGDRWEPQPSMSN